jgi:FkbM family methyltransferase
MIDEWFRARAQVQARGTELLRLMHANNCEFALLGYTKYARDLSAVLERMGRAYYFVCDQRPSRVKRWRAFDAVGNGSVLVNCLVEGRVKSIERLVNRDCFRFFELSSVEPAVFPLPFCGKNQTDLLHNVDRYIATRKKLDQPSAIIFDALCKARFSYNYIDTPFQYQLDKQYADDSVLDIKKFHHFFDGGSFDGANVSMFANLLSAIVVEPSAANMTKCRGSLSRLTNIRFEQCALGSEAGVVHFSGDYGSMSSFGDSKSGEIVTVKTIDSFDLENVDFIKLDIEGAELDALRGATNTISKFRPTMAICTYHSQDHFWQIPQFVDSLELGYRVHLRHYTEGLFESVYYFLPT